MGQRCGNRTYCPLGVALPSLTKVLARQTVKAQLRLRAAFLSWFGGVPILLVSSSAKKLGSMQEQFACLTEPRPVSPCHDH